MRGASARARRDEGLSSEVDRDGFFLEVGAGQSEAPQDPAAGFAAHDERGELWPRETFVAPRGAGAAARVAVNDSHDLEAVFTCTPVCSQQTPRVEVEAVCRFRVRIPSRYPLHRAACRSRVEADQEAAGLARKLTSGVVEDLSRQRSRKEEHGREFSGNLLTARSRDAGDHEILCAQQGSESE